MRPCLNSLFFFDNHSSMTQIAMETFLLDPLPLKDISDSPGSATELFITYDVNAIYTAIF